MGMGPTVSAMPVSAPSVGCTGVCTSNDERHFGASLAADMEERYCFVPAAFCFDTGGDTFIDFLTGSSFLTFRLVCFSAAALLTESAPTPPGLSKCEVF